MRNLLYLANYNLWIWISRNESIRFSRWGVFWVIFEIIFSIGYSFRWKCKIFAHERIFFKCRWKCSIFFFFLRYILNRFENFAADRVDPILKNLIYKFLIIATIVKLEGWNSWEISKLLVCLFITFDMRIKIVCPLSFRRQCHHPFEFKRALKIYSKITWIFNYCEKNCNRI